MIDVDSKTGLRKLSRVLVAEFLLANSDAGRAAARSMLDEAEAMLMAVLADFVRLPSINATVMLTTESANRLTDSNPRHSALLRDGVFILRGELQPETLRTVLRGDSQRAAFDAVLLIAPECDGVLVSLLKAVQESEASPILSLNLNWRLAEIFSDKRSTDVWLRQHSIATIPTRTIDNSIAEALRSTAPQHSHIDLFTKTVHATADQLAVLKPRDGAGAEGVQIVRLNDHLFQDLPQQCANNDRWILQPLMPGIACSVGFIGGGQRGPTTILAPARQIIVVTDGLVSYQGGQIPCAPTIASRITPVAEQIAVALGSFDGYVGTDLLVDLSAPEDSEGSVRVVEVNPRLCTSYVGYRAIAEDNLAAWMLQLQGCKTIQWKTGTVTFSASGVEA